MQDLRILSDNLLDLDIDLEKQAVGHKFQNVVLASRVNVSTSC
jgi:hypothetical protein